MKINIKLALYAFILVIIMQSVFAIGVSPASTILDFEPGAEKTIALRIINNQQKDMVATISARGDLASYIAFDNNQIEFKSNEYEKTVYYTVKIPEQLDKPGSHMTEIIISEHNVGQATVSASLAVISQLIVKVPYPGTYAEAKMTIDSRNLDRPAQFAIAVFNLGNKDLENVFADIELYEENTKINTITTDAISLKFNEKGRLYAEWYPEKPGQYKAIAKVKYSDKEIELSQDFQVGGIDILIEGMSIPDFKLGQIARTYFLITNNWNKKLEKVFVEAIVRDSNGKQVSEIKTPIIDIDKFSSASAVGYWDTENIYPGRYLFEVTVDYLGLKNSKIFDAEVTQNQVKIGNQQTGYAVSGSLAWKPTSTTVLLIILINLIILNAVLFAFLRKKPPKIENFNNLTKLLLFLR